MHAAPQPKPRTLRRHALVAVILAAALALAGAVGSYVAYAAGLAQANYTWFTPGAGDYVLSRPGDIYAFAEIVNGTQPSAINGGQPYSFEGETVHIATGRTPDISDISDPMLKDPTGVAGELPLNVLGTRYEFEPIGTEEHPFQGTFDGGGVTLLNILIDQNAPAAADPRGIGFFGVVGEHGALKDFTVTGAITLKTGSPIDNLGGAAGLVLGTMEGVHSRVNITIENTAATTAEGDAATVTSMTNIGGVAGRAAQSISNCSYDAKMIIKSDLDAAENDGTAPVPTAKYIAGVVGTLGSTTEVTPGVAATNCYNYGDIYTPFTGSGGEDNWGVEISAKPSTMGGIAGFSTGSFYNCGNEGEIRTSARLADSGGTSNSVLTKYDVTNDNGGSNVGGIVGVLRVNFIDSGIKDDVLRVQDCYNTGAVIGSDSVGGMVGSAGLYTLITQCANGNKLAQNVNRETDNTTLPDNQGLVLTTRWNKPYGGGIASSTYGTISYCYNRAVIDNTQAGYYMAGICGFLGTKYLDNLESVTGISDPTYACECYGCYNTGAIGPGHPYGNRYGALLGQNEGYLHDCAIREGCVGVKDDYVYDPDTNLQAFNNSFAVGASLWGNYANLEVMTNDELRTATVTGVLNACCEADGGYDAASGLRYWFTGNASADPDANRNNNYNDGYPVLTAWADPKNGIPLNAARLTELEVNDAVYRSNAEAVPTVRLSYTNDAGITAELRQNADYIIVPEAGAFECTVDEQGAVERPYRYSVQGIGQYSGYVADFGNYGITTGTLDDMVVSVNRAEEDKQTFNWEVQFPNTVEVFQSDGRELSEEYYSWVVYDSGTNTIFSELAPKFEVFNSEGYVVFDDDPDTRVAALDAIPLINQIASAEEKRSFKVYNQERLISDSDGYVYDENGINMTGEYVYQTRTTSSATTETSAARVGYSPIGYKYETTDIRWGHNGPAGYVVEVRGKDVYEGAVQEGRFIIDTPYVDADCDVTVIMPNGEEYLYVHGEEEDYFVSAAEGPSGTPVEIATDFTGASIRPTVEVSYLGRTALVYDEFVQDAISPYHSLHYSEKYGGDFIVDYGGFESKNGTAANPAPPRYLRNRNATWEGSGYGAAVCTTAYPLFWSDKYMDYVTYTLKFQGFIDLDFAINQISAAEVDIRADDFAGLYEPDDGSGPTIQTPLVLSIAGNALREGTDYEVTYKDAAGNPVVTLDESGNQVPAVPSEEGNYTAVVHMLPLNFTDDLPDVGLQNEFPFHVGQAQQLMALTEYREGDPAAYRDWEGDYLPNAQWDIGVLAPAIRFYDLDENGQIQYDAAGEPLLIPEDELEYGHDYVYSITMVPLSQAQPRYIFNLDELSGAGELMQGVEGAWLSYMGGTMFDGLYVTIEGRGRFAGSYQETRWQVEPLDLATTADEDWEISGLKATYYSSYTRKNCVDIAFDHITYKGVFVNRYPITLVKTAADPNTDISAGDTVNISVAHAIGCTEAFTGSKTLASAVVQPCNVADVSWKLDNNKFTYSGVPLEPEASIDWYELWHMTLGEDGEIEYFDNLKAGTGRAVITGNYTLSGGVAGNYIGSKELPFAIQPRNIYSNISEFTIEDIPDQTFTGDEVCPKVTIKDNGLAEGHDPVLEDLVEGRDYILEYADNVDAGLAGVLVTGIGNYTGSVMLTFNINADPTAVRVYVEFAYALDNGRKLAATTSTLVDATALPDYVEDGDGFAYAVDARDFVDVDGWSVLADGTEVHTIGGKQFKLQGDRIKTIPLGLRAKNVVTFEYLNQNPDGSFETMPQVEGMAVDKVMRASDAYAVATVYPTSLSQTVEWKSSDVSIASVDASTGLIHLGEKAGVVKLTATSVYDREHSAELYLANAGPNPRTVTAGGVSITGVPEEVRAVVAASDQANSWLGAYDTMLACFDIRFETDVLDAAGTVLDTVEVQPAGTVSVSVTLPEGFSVEQLYESKCFAYHYADDGSLIEPLSVSPAGTAIAFKLNHFSHIEIFGTIYDALGNVVPPTQDDPPAVQDPPATPGTSQPSGSNGSTQPPAGPSQAPSGGSGVQSGGCTGSGSSGGSYSGWQPSTGSGTPTASGSGTRAQSAPVGTAEATAADDDSQAVEAVSDAEPLTSTGDEVTFGNALADKSAPASAARAVEQDEGGINWLIVLTVAVVLLAAAGGIAYNVIRIRKGGLAQ